MPSVSEIGFAPKFVNDYIYAQLTLFGIFTGLEQVRPIFPTSPISVDEIFHDYRSSVNDPLLIQYERLVKYNPSTFYRHKREQIVYYIYCTTLTKVVDTQRIISAALSREDASASDVHTWAFESGLYPAGAFNVSFHNFKVSQLQETRDLLPLESNKTIFVSKMLVEYDFHTIDALDALYT
jgi:hypothetical protein